MSWDGVDFVGFDTETSGPDPSSAEIVTACVAAREWLLRPTAPIPPSAVAIHGITTERATDAGIDHAAGVAQIRDALYDAWAAGAVLCAFNATYDFTLLARECERYGLGQLEVCGPILDPYVIDKAVDRFRRGKRQLVDVAAHYGVPLSDDDAHGARADADAAAELARKLASNLQSPSKANAQQAKWYRDQRESFAKWLASKGNKAEADEVLRRLEWPVQH
ncbi:exonuclease domain-containing protein [uncultured Tessaracoccus sp.]|uniref:exonuclease domain-containing protein n=1 Tax=uncultured Tessaracoccus sp. TaxID=905023 RepID=UPI002617E261|nr:exonuclease domain-containing protein [uncultured Tessaracoccus sp.]